MLFAPAARVNTVPALTPVAVAAAPNVNALPTKSTLPAVVTVALPNLILPLVNVTEPLVGISPETDVILLSLTFTRVAVEPSSLKP